MSVAVRVETPIGLRTGQRVVQTVRDYIALTKPRVVVLLEVTTVFAMVMAARGLPSFGLVAATVTGGWFAAGGAHAINCWFDRDIDASMGRTRTRPIPAGRVQPSSALAFGTTLGVVAFALLAVAVNLLAAVLAIGGLLFYVFVYTMWLKRRSMQNIVVGGAAGAIPPLVGWAAVQGSLNLTALFLFAVVFYWTPPHFWALALLIRRDYASVSVPMLPVIVGERETRRQILLYTVILVLVTIMPALVHSFGYVYVVGAGVLDALFLAAAVIAVRDPSARAARRVFYYSMLYLALLFAVMAVDRVVG
ncbi:MAG: protoheme IX farnesyltransferase [Candidatus Dormibacteraeota bacterium]|uniref:Protoheme IX farnesyltransferase n=1 Tax=Candidatus Aeolococcus gillhamiae TaxID=3127015 RepID=A0A2W5YY07_9BACT|nr:protoheme IX farnesyltransferase [Candidatus Dormibacteraeota bacterium]PZR77839.1 MAG: protoheme IX farnesyltransferase [Candidatus Dormibacter sp. RRmetagenome_bin12]